MAVVEQVRFSIISQQDIQEIQNEVIQLEDLAERKDVAEQKIQQSELAKRGGIFAPNELDATLPSAITKKHGNALISRAAESKLANSVKSTDKTSAAPFEKDNVFKEAQAEIAALKEEQERIKEEQKKIKEEQRAVKKKQVEAQKKIKEEQRAVKKKQVEAQKAQREAQEKTKDALSFVTDFQGTAATKLIGAASRFIPVGFALSVATTVFALIQAQFGAGGIFDIRKQELNSVKSLIGLERETDIIGGDTLFLGNPTLVQGVAKNQTSNTENLRDGQRRFVLRSNGY